MKFNFFYKKKYSLDVGKRWNKISLSFSYPKKYNKKIKVFFDVEKCDNVFKRMKGLMFRNDGKALLFLFSVKNKNAIHSFFCKPFVAIWFDNDKIIDIKYVKPWRFYIVPKGKYNKLLEIPSENLIFQRITDDRKL